MFMFDETSKPLPFQIPFWHAFLDGAVCVCDPTKKNIHPSCESTVYVVGLDVVAPMGMPVYAGMLHMELLQNILYEGHYLKSLNALRANTIRQCPRVNTNYERFMNSNPICRRQRLSASSVRKSDGGKTSTVLWIAELRKSSALNHVASSRRLFLESCSGLLCFCDAWQN